MNAAGSLSAVLSKPRLPTFSESSGASPAPPPGQIEEDTVSDAAAQDPRFAQLLKEMKELAPGAPGHQSALRLYTADQISEIVSAEFVCWALKHDGAGVGRLHHRINTAGAHTPTYLTQIIQGHRKIFLILSILGITGCIYDVVDKGYNDEALPLSRIELLNNIAVSHITASRFVKEQYRWLLQPLDRHDHTDYTSEEFPPFLCIKELARGSEGSVRVVKNKFNATTYCEKKLADSAINRKELNIRQPLEYKHMLSIFASYTHQEKLHVLLEPVCDCNLWQFLSGKVTIPQYAQMSPDEVQFLLFNWMNCISGAVKYLHDRAIPHGELKPHNILIKGTQVYVADFGIAVQHYEVPKRGMVDGNHPGTGEYAAPEQHAHGQSHVGCAADIFSLGCIFADLVVSMNEQGHVTNFRLARGRWNQGPDYSFHANIPGAIAFLEKLWEVGMTEARLLALINSMWRAQEDRVNIDAVLAELKHIKPSLFYPDQVLCCGAPSMPQKGELPEVAAETIFDEDEARVQT